MSTVLPLDGYFPGQGDDDGSVFIPCLNEACVGGGTCRYGYTGDFCGECEEGLDLVMGSDFVCRRCPTSTVSLVVIGSALLCLTGYIYYTVSKKTKGKFPKTRSTFFKIVTSSAQVNSMALLYAFDWKSAFVSALEVQQDVTSLGTTYLELECIFPDFCSSRSVLSETLILMIVPMAVA
jgi:hypothetical protein